MIEQFKSRAAEVTAGFTAVQKMTMGLVFAAVLGGLWFFSSWASTTDMATLYADLETADAAAITDELDSLGIPYELVDRGRTVLVPRDEVYDIRLDMSTAGLPNGGAVGYSLLDNQGITSTQFQQRIAYQRALEGELSKTIRHIESIEAVSVHLVIPEDDLFAADNIHASASVLVETRSTLAPEQVQAIVNLVAGSVEGLRVDDVTVADQTGLVLAAPGQSPFERAGAGGAANKTRTAEQDLAASIQKMLVAVVGPGNVIVTAAIDMDWNASSTISEVRTPSAVPDGAPPLYVTETISAEEYTTTTVGADNGGVLGEDDDGSSPSTSESAFNSSDTERVSALDLEVTTRESIGGDIQRVNIAVLLDEASSTEEQLAEIQALVATAAGIDAARGDTITVSRLAFDTTIEEALAVNAETAAAAAEVSDPSGMIRMGVLGALGFLILVAAIIQFWRGRRVGEEVEELDLVTLTNSLAAGSARPVMSAPAAIPAARSAAPEPNATPEQELQLLVNSQPDEVARLLRTWLADRRAVAR